MRKALVLYKNEKAGTIIQNDDGSFIFRYDDNWLNDTNKPAISLTLPKKEQEYTSGTLFPFFYSMLPEGSNKQVVCFQNRIDDKDNFGLLLTIAKHDTIGAVRIQKIEEE
jgi:serine/threonine-protein kinase HipA